MSGIEGVNGPIADADLGCVLVHEHIAASSAGIIRSWPELFGGREALVNLGVRALEDAKAAGVGTIVDCTTFDVGRDPELLAEVSASSDVNIVACTGVWLDPSVTVRARSVDELTDRFIRDLTVGMDGTSIRAGVIKVASDKRVEPFAAMVLEAAARASTATSAPIITHTAAQHRTGDQQATILESFGIDPTRVAIGHCDDSSDVEYLSTLASRGYRIAMDRLPNGALSEYGGQSVEDRINMIASLVGRGYSDRILLSHDDPVWVGLLTDEDQARHKESNPRLLTFVSAIVLPALERKGVAAADIRRMTVENPRRWLVAS